MTSLYRACRVRLSASALVALMVPVGPTLALAQVLSQTSTPPQAPPPVTQDAPRPEDVVQTAEEPPEEPPPGYIVSVEGSAVLERDNTAGDAITGMPLLVGDRLRSEGGQLEIKWAERSELKLARYTELDVLSRAMVRVPRGRVTINLITPPGQSVSDQLAIDAPGASVRFYMAGEYQIAVGGTERPEVELFVIRGSAQLASDRGQTLLAEGERAMVRDGSVPTAAAAYDVASLPREGSTYDPTDDLAAFQRSSAGGAYQGTPYLPTEMYGYETVLDSYGSWESEPSYGQVWYPRVAADWRPYYRGRWHHVPRYGWTWLGAERWAYPTHHYGRWGFSSSGRWFWRPSRTWGSAWVSWAVAPSYVGWCPLGWDGRPVFSFYNFNTGYVARGRDPWRGWTVIPSQRFGYRYDVPRYRVDHRVLVRERPAFITAWAAPRHPGRGVVSYGQDLRPRDSGSSTRGSNYAPQRMRGSGPVPPSPGYSGYYPGGYRPGAIPRDRDGRDESPYDRARRVMERRGGDERQDDDGDTNGSRASTVRRPGTTGMSGPGVIAPGGAPGGNVPRGRSDDNSGVRGAYPRYGTTRQPRGDDRGDRRVSPSEDSGGSGGSVRVPSASPYRHAPGTSRPSDDDAAGVSRRPSPSSGEPRQYAPSGGRRNDDGGSRSPDGYAGPRHANPETSRDRGSDRPTGVSAPRGGGDDRGGRGGDRGGDRGDRGGRTGASNDGGRSAGGSSSSDRGSSDRGSSDRGRSEGGGGRRHPR